MQEIARHRLVIVDPLRMFHDLGESDGAGMDFFARWLVSVAMANQQAILLVHHASQAAILDSRTDHHTGRGATDLPAACRAAWTIRKMTAQEARQAGLEEDERCDWRLLTQAKASHAREGAPRWLRRDERHGLWMQDSFPAISQKSNKKVYAHDDF